MSELGFVGLMDDRIIHFNGNVLKLTILQSKNPTNPNSDNEF
jgi:hypothetical protein